MRWNPILRKGIIIDSRSSRLPVIIFFFNLILSAAGIFNLAHLTMDARETATIRYESIIQLYSLISTMEFMMLLVITPALTAPAICSEREGQMLDLLQTTSLGNGRIVAGKLESAVIEMMALLVSALPVQSLVFIFGGATALDLLLPLIAFFVAILFIGGMGIFSSAICRRTVAANVVSYILTVFMTGGTWLIAHFARWISARAADGEAVGTAGGWLYGLLFNPAVTYMCVIDRQAGDMTDELTSLIGYVPKNPITEHWIPVSLLLQLIAAACFIAGAVRIIAPGSGYFTGKD
ncbi:hypothetical protein SAMN04487771_101227 [[Clostridium] aminophilum]|uniref:ABC-2 family transporter protein n=1 Tax=[Clostridium] aminophilum TaxID=1526 RepID=A0A1I0DIK6_9FIRM|nr:hypothetical protein [[Clostridium] aminophilum]SET31459.1 hypothetical protein SAMN04487771_101227 [[Clostridium] aminophilum]